MPPDCPYWSPSPDGCLRLGELISDLEVATIDSAALRDGGETSVVLRAVPLAIVLSQSCDLQRHYDEFQKSGGVSGALDDFLPNQLHTVLLAPVYEASQLKSSVKGGDLWKRAKQNADVRYHYLEALPPECDAKQQGLPDLALDFRQHWTMPIHEMYVRLGKEARCRAVLVVPFAEHLADRFYHYLARIGVPQTGQAGPEIAGAQGAVL